MHSLGRSHRRRGALTGTLIGVMIALVVGTAVQAREPGSIADRMSTLERLSQPGWWPTKTVGTRKDYVGAQVCAQCHASVAATAKDTEMARALLRPEESEILRAREGQSFELESYSYKLERTTRGYQYSVGHGRETTTHPITWAFGDGNISQVFVTEDHGNFYESHFSYYSGIDRFDRTTNQPRRAESLRSAGGRSVMGEEVRRCFACHAAAVPAEGDYGDILPGVTCEACHGPGADHVSAMKAGIEGGEGFIFNPGRLDRTAAVDFCGSCHLTWVDVELGDLTGAPTIRFPAYRLQNSQCWAKGDARIACTSCHDPHQPLSHNPAYYDQKCLGCHVGKTAMRLGGDHPGKACPESDHNCASCHMPKREFPDTHFAFTDHDIRVVRAGEPVPD